MLNMFAAMAQFEREIMLERQREGIAKGEDGWQVQDRKPTARAKAENVVRLYHSGTASRHLPEPFSWGLLLSLYGASRLYATLLAPDQVEPQRV
jgi:DNA invertase Pin-like site-specific DNA recombinase